MLEKLQPISILQFETSYLAHPVPLEKEAEIFQKELEALGITVINPFGEQRKLVEGKDWSPQKWYERAHSPQEAIVVVERDLNWIKNSDSLIAFIPNSQGFGTAMEIFYAARLLNKPVFIYTSKKYRFHPWLMYFGQVFTNRSFMLDILRLRQKLESKNMRIAIGGGMGTGKSTIADFLHKCFQFKKYSFAAKLKELAADLFNMEVKDRLLLQVLGSKVRDVNKDVWAQYVIKMITEIDKPLHAVIDDMRYLNEAKLLREHDFTLIKLYTPKTIVAKRGVAGFSDAALSHPSEVEINSITVKYAIDTSGSIERCYHIMMDVLKMVGGVNE